MQVFSTRTDKPKAYDFIRPTEALSSTLPINPIEFSISPDQKRWVSYFDVPDLEGVYVYQAPDVQPAVQTDNLQKIALNDGQTLVSSSYETRQLKMLVALNTNSEGSALLGYDALQRFLVSRDGYWICFANWPQRMYYVKAKVNAPTFTGNDWICEVDFTDLCGLSRSVGTTADSNRVMGFGNNDPSTPPSYQFNTDKFTVHNGSDVLIDPERRGHEFKLTVKGSANNMTIKNLTTGDVIKRSGGWSGTWVLDGVNPILNGDGDLKNLADGYDQIITLQIGDNDFEVSGVSGTLTFDFAEWWLS